MTPASVARNVGDVSCTDVHPLVYGRPRPSSPDAPRWAGPNPLTQLSSSATAVVRSRVPLVVASRSGWCPYPQGAVGRRHGRGPYVVRHVCQRRTTACVPVDPLRVGQALRVSAGSDVGSRHGPRARRSGHPAAVAASCAGARRSGLLTSRRSHLPHRAGRPGHQLGDLPERPGITARVRQDRPGGLPVPPTQDRRPHPWVELARRSVSPAVDRPSIFRMPWGLQGARRRHRPPACSSPSRCPRGCVPR